MARALIEKAKADDVAMAREACDRIIARPTPAEPHKDENGEDKHVVIRLEFDNTG